MSSMSKWIETPVPLCALLACLLELIMVKLFFLLMLYILPKCGVVIYGGTMLPGCGKKHKNLSAGSPFEVCG